MAVAIPSILDSIPDLASYKSVTDRYFSKRYVLNANDIQNNDIMILFHSNRITLITLAPSHFFFKNNLDYKVNYTFGRIDRLSNSVKGKGKRGGQKLGPKSVLCKVDFSDGACFEVPSCMTGTLVEINEELLNKPNLLREHPDSDGYIAIVLSSIELSEAMKNEFLDHEQYMKICENAK